MEIQVVPEPAPAERQAVEQALAELAPDRADGRSAWWRAGAREAVTPEEEPD